MKALFILAASFVAFVTTGAKASPGEIAPLSAIPGGWASISLKVCVEQPQPVARNVHPGQLGISTRGVNQIRIGAPSLQ